MMEGVIQAGVEAPVDIDRLDFGQRQIASRLGIRKGVR